MYLNLPSSNISLIFTEASFNSLCFCRSSLSIVKPRFTTVLYLCDKDCSLPLTRGICPV